ncbi:MAG: DUF2207 domain-containing protein [bacterium]|nr:DUF2207 domain-containing protein [bacterium]
MKKIVSSLFVLFISFVLSASALAENFYIKNYIVDLNVDNQKVLNVSEFIETNFFNEGSHGIYRQIPVSRGSKVDDIRVAYNTGEGWERAYTASYDGMNRMYSVKIGRPNVTIFGDVTYQIEYQYTIGDKNDNIYFNLIGTGWRTNINQAKFRITMPDSIDEKDVKFFVGKKGTTTSDNRIKFFVDNNRYTDSRSYIEGEITAPLLPYEGVTIKVDVPKGYFDIHKNIWDYLLENIQYVILALILLLTYAGYQTWNTFGKDYHIVPVVNFNPPEKMNSAEVELFYRGKATNKSLISLVFYLANKGYLKITQKESFLGGTDFTLEKLKDYDGTNKIEAEFFNKLFFKKVVTKADLGKSATFNSKCIEIIEKINKNREKVFERQSLSWKLKLKMGLLILGDILLTVLYMCDLNIAVLAPCLFMLLFIFIAIMVLVAVGPEPFIIIWSLGFGGIPLIGLFALSGFNFSPISIIGIVGVVIIAVCFYHLPKRSQYSAQVFGQILGFKRFLETAEKERLKEMVEENPAYFYDILPYAYVLDVSDRWIKKFEGIMANPDWYNSSSPLSAHSFNSFSNAVQSAGCSSYSSSSGGGGHGGGCSGGGHGGGGGGSW